MKRNVAGVAAVLTAMVIHTHSVPADACGVKLTIKTQGPRHASQSKADVLLIGSQSGRLKGDLVAAGHKVDTASTTAEAKRSGYTVVITDENEASQTRQAYPNSTVIVASKDPAADVRAADTRIARRPVRAEEKRQAIAAREMRTPIATGPERNPNTATRTPVATGTGGVNVATTAPTKTETPAKPTKPETPAKPPEKTEKVEATVKPPVETPAVKPEKTPPVEKTVEKVEKPAKPAAVASFQGELHFAPGGYGLSAAAKAQLEKDARWLADNAGVSVTVEGHADPSGTPDANMALSQNRAEAVRDYLVTKGVDSSRLEVAAFGDTRLKYGAADGRNRRVMLVKKE